MIAAGGLVIAGLWNRVNLAERLWLPPRIEQLISFSKVGASLPIRLRCESWAKTARPSVAKPRKMPSAAGCDYSLRLRTRFAEEALAAAVKRGVRQVVVLGAGLDTYAYRSPFSDRLRIFEVDHPATQAWKRRRLASASIPLPGSLSFAPIDFERETLSDGLAAAGFDPAQQTFFTWLGVVPYLTEEAVWSTLGFIASLPNGAHVVLDYSDPPDSLSPEARATHERRAAQVQAIGETWVSHFDAGELQAKLRALGSSEVEDLGPPEIVARYFPNRTAPAPERGGHILRASTRGG